MSLLLKVVLFLTTHAAADTAAAAVRAEQDLPDGPLPCKANYTSGSHNTQSKRNHLEPKSVFTSISYTSSHDRISEIAP